MTDRTMAIRGALIEHVATDLAAPRRRGRNLSWLAGGVVLGCALTAGTYAVASTLVLPEEEAELNLSPETGSALEYFMLLSDQEGFVSGGLGAGETGLELYWHGEPAGEAAALIDQARAEGIEVTIMSAAHDPDEFRQDGVAFVEALEAAGIEVTGWGPNRAHDTFEIMGPLLSVDEDLQAQAAAIADDMFGDEYAVTFLPNEDNPVIYPAPAPSER